MEYSPRSQTEAAVHLASGSGLMLTAEGSTSGEGLALQDHCSLQQGAAPARPRLLSEMPPMLGSSLLLFVCTNILGRRVHPAIRAGMLTSHACCNRVMDMQLLLLLESPAQVDLQAGHPPEQRLAHCYQILAPDPAQVDPLCQMHAHCAEALMGS